MAKCDKACNKGACTADEAYKILSTASTCKSLVKKHFTQDVLNKLKDKKTSLGATLLDCVQSGVANLDAGVGIYAPDPESYKVFSELFTPIILEYHKLEPNFKQPAKDLGDGKLDYFKNLDPENKYINSTRIRMGRSLKGYALNTKLTEKDYLEMETKVQTVLQNLTDNELKGTYYPLDGMNKATQTKLIADHFLFKNDDRHLKAAGASNFWPKGRGIFHNEAKTFLVWVNEEDHLRIISMQNGGDVKSVLSRLIKGITTIEAKLPFIRDDKLGYITFCPTNLGTTVRASVHIKLPKVSARKDFVEICEKMNLQTRGIHGEHSDSVGGVYDISNKRRLGLSEYDAVKEMYDGVKKLIEMEKNGGK